MGTLPGLTGVDHFGFTVPDLQQADRFLVETLGCEYLYSLGPYDRADGWMRERLDVHPDTSIPEIRFYRLDGKAILEVFQYDSPDQKIDQPRNSDVGGHHVALYVEDLDAAVEYLRSEGVRIMGGPTASAGPHEGQRWIYFLSPWGMQFELVSYPAGKAFQRWERERTLGLSQ
jgi:catechol 2,3-dioxygenase-like lactoylglutathione lyase family enzyme